MISISPIIFSKSMVIKFELATLLTMISELPIIYTENDSPHEHVREAFGLLK